MINTNNVSRSIGNGVGLTDFANEYNMDAEQIKAEILVACKGNEKFAHRLINGLEKNERRTKKSKEAKKSAKPEQSTSVKGASKLERVEPEQVEQEQADSANANEATPTLEQLKEMREGIYSSLMEAEKHCSDLDTKHNDQLQVMEQIKAKVEVLKAELLKYGDEFKKACDADDEIVAEKKDATEVRRSLKKRLEEIESEISEKSIIQLYVFNDGTYNISSSVEINTDGYEVIHEALIKDERCENLTIVQIRSLAKALAIAKNLEGFKVEAVFDIKEMDSLFLEMSQN